MQDLIKYTTDKNIQVEFNHFDNDIWLTQKQIAILFCVTVKNISLHLQKIFDSGEIDKNRAMKSRFIAQKEGKRIVNKEIFYYNLEVIVLVGFRVRSKQAKSFQEWTTNIIRAYELKGFVINPNIINSEEAINNLTNRVNELRTDEAVIYAKLKAIIAKSSDYNSNSDIAQGFYGMVQNKIYYAATLMTSAEIKVNRADANKPFMGTETRKSKNLTKADANTAKSYLKEKELFILQRLSTIFIDSADLAELTNQSHTMQYWVNRIDMIIKDNVLSMLEGYGKITPIEAEKHIDKEYIKYKENLKIENTKKENVLF